MSQRGKNVNIFLVVQSDGREPIVGLSRADLMWGGRDWSHRWKSASCQGGTALLHWPRVFRLETVEAP